MSNPFAHNDLCVGIDLGTTNSVLSTINIKANGDIVSKVVDIPRAVDMYSTMNNEKKFHQSKKPTLPSCVYYDEERNYQIIVGDFAKSRYSLRPHLVAKSIKSQMGSALAEGLSDGVPDKTPAQISARILEHMIKATEKIYRTEIHDAIITVPASFDSVMCKATRDAAQLAGITVVNSDGSERPVLLYEPRAVIYDFVNQVHNGEIAGQILDLSTPKNVMVFDLGGGTLDITLHRLARREDNPDILKIDDIAINRYTLLGGDDFDAEIAKYMFQRYLAKYQKRLDIINKIRREENAVMAQLGIYAEELKLELSSRHSDVYIESGWGDEEEGFPVGGTINSTGYAYDETFTTEEIEKILLPFMGADLKFEDFKRIDEIKDTKNIISPILEVLAKAAEKLGTDNLKIDAVIMNGGMSKFYMVTDRLEKFFGFAPISVLDPDQSVARGAAIYHHYLHKHEIMQDDMRKIEIAATAAKVPSVQVQPKERLTPIEWGKPILNDALYLGTRNDTHVMIVPTGAELPFKSELMTGYRIMPGNDRIIFPIQRKNLDNSYRTIARGKINFSKAYKDSCFVALQIFMGVNKVITINAWSSEDEQGLYKIEEGNVDIVIGDESKVESGGKIISRKGETLNPIAEMNAIEQKCRAYENIRGKGFSWQKKRSNAATEIRTLVENVINAGNPNDFAEPILKGISRHVSSEFNQRCFIIARRIGENWTADQKKRLAALCMEQLSGELQGLHGFGYSANLNTKIQALYALHICGSPQDIAQITKLHGYDKFLAACLYVHAKTKTQVNWIYEKFLLDVKNVFNSRSSTIQNSSHAMGVVFCDTDAMILDGVNRNTVLRNLNEVITYGRINSTELVCCIIAAGCIADQRNAVAVDANELQRAVDILENLQNYYISDDCQKAAKAQGVALKLMRGQELDIDEERFLLEKLNN